MGGVALHEGQVLEMKTGEGVHLVTGNETVSLLEWLVLIFLYGVPGRDGPVAQTQPGIDFDFRMARCPVCRF